METHLKFSKIQVKLISIPSTLNYFTNKTLLKFLGAFDNSNLSD